MEMSLPKNRAFVAGWTMVVIAIVAIEVFQFVATRKPKEEEVIYVLPRVEDMAVNPNPLSF